MPLYTTLASLSQTAASNAADGAADAPSTIDQQTNLLASFIAQLRDTRLSATDFGAWTTAGISVTSSVGALANASAFINYKLIGKTAFFNLVVTIISNGTGAGVLQVVMPWTSVKESGFGGRESQSAGWTVGATIAAGSTTLLIVKYDATYPGGNSYRIAINGVMETT